MTASSLEKYLTQLIECVSTEASGFDEVELGFDTMLGHEGVSFLIAHHPIAGSLSKGIRFPTHEAFVLDEHELAMV